MKLTVNYKSARIFYCYGGSMKNLRELINSNNFIISNAITLFTGGIIGITVAVANEFDLPIVVSILAAAVIGVPGQYLSRRFLVREMKNYTDAYERDVEYQVKKNDDLNRQLVEENKKNNNLRNQLKTINEQVHEKERSSVRNKEYSFFEPSIQEEQISEQKGFQQTRKIH